MGNRKVIGQPSVPAPCRDFICYALGMFGVGSGPGTGPARVSLAPAPEAPHYEIHDARHNRCTLEAHIAGRAPPVRRIDDRILTAARGGWAWFWRVLCVDREHTGWLKRAHELSGGAP
jgi:hypothetical protein